MSIVHISVTYKTKTWSLIPHLRKTVNKSYGILFQEMKKKCYRKSRHLDFLEIILKSINLSTIYSCGLDFKLFSSRTNCVGLISMTRTNVRT